MKIVITFVLLFAGSFSVTVIGKIQMTELRPVKRNLKDEEERKAMMITSINPSVDPSIYRPRIQPENNFVMPVPQQTGRHFDVSNHFSHFEQPVANKFNHAPRTEAEVKLKTKGNTQVSVLPSEQYDQLYNRATNHQFVVPSDISENDLGNRIVNKGRSIFSKITDKTNSFLTAGALLLTNGLKVQTGIMNNAQNDYVSAYAKEINGNLSEISSDNIQNVQNQAAKKQEANPNSTEGANNLGKMPSMYSSSYGSGFLKAI